MIIDLLPTEADLLHMLLQKELEELRVEIHHADRTEFKEHLQTREAQIRTLLERVKHLS